MLIASDENEKFWSLKRGNGGRKVVFLNTWFAFKILNTVSTTQERLQDKILKLSLHYILLPDASFLASFFLSFPFISPFLPPFPSSFPYYCLHSYLPACLPTYFMLIFKHWLKEKWYNEPMYLLLNFSFNNITFC